MLVASMYGYKKPLVLEDIKIPEMMLSDSATANLLPEMRQPVFAISTTTIQRTLINTVPQLSGPDLELVSGSETGNPWSIGGNP